MRLSTTTQTLLISLLSGFALVGVAHGQENAVALDGGGNAPEMLLLIDSSREMSQRIVGFGQPSCDAGPVRDDMTPQRAFNLYSKTRMMVVQEALAGRSALGDHWCVLDNREGHHYNDGQLSFVHARAMCCELSVANDCKDWAPCNNDHGKARGFDDATRNLQAFTDDGFIQQNIETVRFGVMSFDVSAQKEGPQDTASFGGEVLNVPQSVADATSFPGGGVTQPNMGIRTFDAINGRSVDGERGVPGGINIVVSEQPASIAAHNRYVMDELRRIVPMGRAPVAAALTDLEAHISRRNEEGGNCRRRIAVLILGSVPTDYYGGQPCNDNNDCAGGSCELGQGGLRACKYPEGWPYQTSEAAAAALDASGVTVYVIGVGPKDSNPLLQAKVASIAAASGGEDENDGWFWAENADELKRALNVIKAKNSTSRQGRTPPLMVTPTKADLKAMGDGNNNTKVWQVSAYAQLATDTDNAWFGVVNREDFVCGGNDALVSQGVTGFHEGLNQDDLRRRAFTPSDDGGVEVVMGGINALFDEDGVPDDSKRRRIGVDYMGMDDALFDLDGDADENADEAGVDVNERHRVDYAGQTLAGFFGPAGLPDGRRAQGRGTRRLGAVIAGKMTAISSPNASFTSPAYKAFKDEYKDRPTVIAVPANDGAVHVFRAHDGAELANLVPREVWPKLDQMENTLTVDGDLVSGDLPVCRNMNAQGGLDCPNAGSAQVNFRTFLVGTLGRAGKGIYGVDATNLGMLEENAIISDQLLFPANIGSFPPWSVSTREVESLGNTVSEPALTQVRIGNQAKAAVIVGCGEDPERRPGRGADRPGRCVLVIDAFTGEVIREFSTARSQGITGELDGGMVGAPAVWPPQTGAVAKLVYIGDSEGRLWRLNLMSDQPNQWTLSSIWPVAGDDAQGYEGGGAITSKPVIVNRTDGQPTIIFTTEKRVLDADGAAMEESDGGFAASISDVRDRESGEFAVSANWVLPLSEGEGAVGDPVAMGDAVLFTTLAEVDDNACGSAQGKLYGVKAVGAHVDADGEPEARALGDGRSSRVMAGLPLGDDESALAVVLPPGRVAYGLITARMPSCGGGAEVEQVVLNLADESNGASGDQMSTEQMQVETLEDGRGVTRKALDGAMFAESSGTNLSVCMNCDADGVVKESATTSRPAQGSFPTSVTHWGSSFAD
ncbi:MAG: PilC/PilY family type IV pilus protein [Bradymonadia bacterium]